MPNLQMSFSVSSLIQAYQSNEFTPSDMVALILEKLKLCEVSNIWIHLASAADLQQRAQCLQKIPVQARASYPLFGIPFAVKDNIDVAGMPTTAACPDFSYTPTKSAFIVEKLLEAGAIFVGKTNMDQFASGLSGTRSPYGAIANPFNREYISGGSSSGSAVAVACGLVSFALGTDTAGSGRVPAALNNIIGLKPTRGALSNRGIVPACLSLDCPTVFALTCQDAWEVFRVMAIEDRQALFFRKSQWPAANIQNTKFTFGVPASDQRCFFGDEEAEQLFEDAIQAMVHMGGRPVEIDYEPFREAAQLLYEGPWLAERYAAIDKFIETSPDSVHEVTYDVISKGKQHGAVETFQALYRLESLKNAVAPVWDQVDFLLLPTTGTAFTIEAMRSNPIDLNTKLGYYTNFMNLLDLSAWAVPVGFQSNKVPFGVTLVAPAFHECLLGPIAARFHQSRHLPLGYSQLTHPTQPERFKLDAQKCVPIAVFGLHLSEQPLNHQLLELGARFDFAGTTASRYQLFVVDQGTPKARPAAVISDWGKGVAIELEVWQMPIENVGKFLVNIPPPLGLGNVLLSSGEVVKGFICEGGTALEGSEEITRFGGWINYINHVGKPR